METLKKAVADNFGFIGILSLNRIEAGFLSANYAVDAGGKRFFLKGYRFEDSQRIAEIHRIKSFFASKGIPVILPISTKEGKTFFTVDEKHYALFPFVTGVHPQRGSIPPHIIEALGAFIARMHAAGRECDFFVREKFADKDARSVITTACEIIGIIEAKVARDDFDKLALDSLRIKIMLTERDTVAFDRFITESPILLQGDFHEQNIFFDEAGNVKYVFDFEKAVMGLRSFELWRSADYMFLNGYFSKDRIGNVIAYFKAYNHRNPISSEELSNGLEVYYQRCIKSLWVEKEHYLKGNKKTDAFLENRTILFLSEHRDSFLKEIASALYSNRRE
jgi:Ser/Thr protein kinase RdoA (MazF antagonist)